MDNIIKQIVLKFKTEGVSEVQKTAATLSKSFSANEVDRFLKAVERVKQSFSGSYGLNKDLSKISDIFKEINTKHLKDTEKQITAITAKIREQAEALQKLKESGAPAEEISKATENLRKLKAEFEYTTAQMPERQPLYQRVAGHFMRGAAAFGGIAGAAHMAAKPFEMYRNLLQSEMGYRTFVGEYLKHTQMEALSGHMERALLYSDPVRASLIAERSRKLKTADTLAEGALSGVSILGGAAATLGAAAKGFGLSSLAAGLVGVGAAPLALGIGGLTAMGYGLYRGYEYFFGGGKEAKAIEAKKRAEQEAASMTLAPELLSTYYELAPMRARVQRLFNLTDEEALTMRKRFREQMVREGEMEKFIMPFRRFGSGLAEDLGVGAATAARRYGITQESAIESMRVLALYGKGGPARAAENLDKILKEAVAAGIKDSGLIEEYQKTVAALMQITGDQISTKDLTDIFKSFMPESPNQERALRGAVTGMTSFGQVLHGTSPLMEATKTAGAIKLSKNPQGEVDLSLLQYIESLPPERLAMMDKDPFILKSLERMGLSPEESQKRIEEFKKQMVGVLSTTGLSFSATKDILSKIEAGQPLEKYDLQRLAIAMHQFDLAQKGTDEDLQAFAAPILKSLTSKEFTFKHSADFTPEETAKMPGADPNRKILQTTTGEAAPIEYSAQPPSSIKFMQKRIESEGLLDEQIQKQIEQKMEKILSLYETQVNETMKQLDEEFLKQPIQKIGEAANEIANALVEASRKIKTPLEENTFYTRPRGPGE